MLTHRKAPMNPRYYHRHTPLLDPRRKRCPVCQHAVYSPAGIHPQCAERQADPPRPKGAPNVSLPQDERAINGAAIGVVGEPPAV